MKSFFPGCMSSLFLLCASLYPAGADDMDLASILQKELDLHRIPAISVSLIRNNRIVQSDARGVRQMGSSAPVAVGDAFYIGSVTKPLTAALMMVLDQNGIMPIGTRLFEVFPELARFAHPGYETLTIRELLDHSSGMGYSPETFPGNGYNDTALSAESRRYLYTLHAVIDIPKFKVGTGYEYGGGTISAAAMAEKRTGKTWEALMQEYLLGPLGMESAGFGFLGAPGVISPVRGHALQEGGYVSVSQAQAHPAWTNAPAGSNLHLSAPDLARFMLSQMGNNPDRPRLLSRGRLYAMQTLSQNQRMGLGWVVDFDAWGNYHTVLHTGDNGHGIAVAAFAPQFGMGYVILVNASGKPAWDALTSVQDQIRAYLQTRRDSDPGNGKIPFASQALNYQKPVIVNNVWNNHGSYTADKAVDGDVTTRWATDQRSAGHYFLESDLGSEQTISGVLIREEFSPRVNAYRLLVRSNSDHNWRTVVAEGRLTQETYIKLNPLMARYVRLELDSNPQAEPTLSAFLIFPPGFDYDRF